jgi:cell filamentation protein
MYESTADPYCYPGSSVLKNRLDLRTQSELETYEKFISTQRADEPLPIGRLTYSHYRAIHRHLFQDVYTWAGRIRTIRIAKEDSWFCYPEYIDREMRRIFEELAGDNCFRDLDAETFARKAAHFLSELNAIHPFREGNGRTQSVFLTILADQAGHPLDLERLDPPAKMMNAMIASFTGDERPLRELLLRLMRG